MCNIPLSLTCQDYKQKPEKLSGRFDTLYNQQHDVSDGNGDGKEGGDGTFITQSEEMVIDSTKAEGLNNILSMMAAGPAKKKLPPVNLEVAMQRFDGERDIM